MKQKKDEAIKKISRPGSGQGEANGRKGGEKGKEADSAFDSQRGIGTIVVCALSYHVHGHL